MLPSRFTTIHRLRLAKGLSRKRVEREAPINRKTLKRLEEGKGEPQSETVQRLAAYYGVRPDWLLTQHHQDQAEIALERAASELDFERAA